jgi:hypothetical protein
VRNFLEGEGAKQLQEGLKSRILGQLRRIGWGTVQNYRTDYLNFLAFLGEEVGKV